MPPIVQMFGGIQNASSPLRILIISRHTDPLAAAFRRLQASISVVARSINVGDTLPDIRSYVANAVEDLSGNEGTRQNIIAKVLEKSAGCPLWVRLAIEEVQELGHTQAGVEAALENLPAYGREDGCIYLASATSGNEVQKLYSHATTVFIVAHIWSTSGDLMAAADNSGRFILRRLNNDGNTTTRMGHVLI